MFHPVYNWGYYTDPDPHMNNRKIYWPRGRGLGGSSSINGLIYVRGQAEDYDAWATAGNAGWGWKDVLPYFIKSEHNTRGASEYHGSGGPLWASDIGEKHELMEAIIRAGNERGVPRNDDFNGATQEGVGYYQLFTRQGWRCSTAVAYLKPAQGSRRTCASKPNAHATGIIFEGTRAVGLRYRQHGQDHEVRAAREVVLSAGALQSPQLLQLSGVGDAARLQALGIPVSHHLPGVGENLQDHLQLRLMYKVKKPITTNDDLQSWWRQFKMGWKWITERKGPLAIGINQGGMFTRILPDRPRPTSSSTSPRSRPRWPAPNRTPGRAALFRCASCGRIRAAPCSSNHATRCRRRACSPTTCRTKPTAVAPWNRSSSRATWRRRRHWATTSARNTAPAPALPATRKPWTGRATTAPRSSTRPAPARWATTRWP
jgi:choline dehydrogenase